MAVSAVRFRRRVTGAAGAPSTLKTAEPSYNMVDGFLRIGYGDDASGGATSIRVFGKDDFLYNIPAVVSGKILGESGGVPAWITPPTGGTTYTAGTGITISAGAIATDMTVVAPLASPALTGNPTVPTQTAGNSSTRIASTAYVQTEINSLLNGAGAAYNTFKELQDLIVADESTASALATTVGGKLTKASNLSDLTDVSAARGNLSLGSMALQASSSVTITGGTISGVDIDGGTF